MTAPKTCTVEGVAYEAHAPLNGRMHCDSCAARFNGALCEALPDCATVIWIKQEPQP